MKANPEIVVNVNMSLRDYFAAKAMQGLLTNFGYEENGYAQSAYKIADAMLAAREAGK